MFKFSLKFIKTIKTAVKNWVKSYTFKWSEVSWDWYRILRWWRTFLNKGWLKKCKWKKNKWLVTETIKMLFSVPKCYLHFCPRVFRPALGQRNISVVISFIVYTLFYEIKFEQIWSIDNINECRHFFSFTWKPPAILYLVSVKEKN